MKKTLFISALLLTSFMAMAQNAVITFKETEHDFGKIREDGGRVSYVFEFTNDGAKALALKNVRASCGCTTPDWSREPIAPGQTGHITVTYNPNGRPGRFSKTITVTSDAEPTTVKLSIKGEVIPKQAKPVNKYSFKIGELSVKTKQANFMPIMKGNTQTVQIEYANLTTEDMTVSVYSTNACVTAQATLETLKPNESGMINILFDTKATNVWGEQKYPVYVVVNGKKEQTDEYKIEVNADVKEDFTKLTAEDLQVSPIIVIDKELNLGTLKAGQRVKKSITLKNAGIQPLIIRRVNSKHSNDVRASVGKLTVKSGKTTDLKIDVINTIEQKGAYLRQIELITNDPKNPIVVVSVVWTVE